jgi:membrane-bound lytic murein transglycosylase B
MKNFARLALMTVCLCCLSTPVVQAQEGVQEFSAWLAQLRVDASAAGISPATLDVALSGIEAPLQQVLDRDRKQPEMIQPLGVYVATRVSEERIAAGRRMLLRYHTWLGKIERQYQVQRRFIVALWGIESNYGRNTGNLEVIPALVTLAYDARRGDYFRKELLDALYIVDAKHIPLSQLKGSWAGAMGAFQFMPSTYRHYAVDADGDGRIDIWSSVPDALASAANYLAKAGWQNGQTWGRPVKLPETLDYSLAGLETSLPLSRWQALGVRRSNGKSLPHRDLQASLIAPDGRGGPAYLVYHNLRVLRRWNRSSSFAVAVGTLADSYAAQK